MIKDLELIKDITVRYFENFSERSRIVPENYEPLISRSLAELHGQEWRQSTATINSTFSDGQLKGMFKLLNDCRSHDLKEHLVIKCRSSKSVNMEDILSRCANDVIASVAFGIKVNSLKDPNNEFYFQFRLLVDNS